VNCRDRLSFAAVATAGTRRDGETALPNAGGAGAGPADQYGVALLANEVTTGEVTHERLRGSILDWSDIAERANYNSRRLA
jgi:hypothetical protein